LHLRGKHWERDEGGMEGPRKQGWEGPRKPLQGRGTREMGSREQGWGAKEEEELVHDVFRLVL